MVRDNSAPLGANLYLWKQVPYVMPVPAGYWLPATECKVYRQSAECESWDTDCQSAEKACAEDTNEIASGCQPVTFYQPCDWSTFPEFVGQTIYSLPQGAYDDDLPFACSTGVLVRILRVSATIRRIGTSAERREMFDTRFEQD